MSKSEIVAAIGTVGTLIGVAYGWWLRGWFVQQVQPRKNCRADRS